MPRARAAQANVEDSPGAVNDAIWQTMQNQIANALPEQDIKPANLAPVTRTHKYVFRTVPGKQHRGLALKIPMPPASLNSMPDATSAFYQERYEHQFPKSEQDVHSHIIDAIGGYFIQFKPVFNKQEGYFATDDKVVASYIRGLIKGAKGKKRLAGVYEDASTIKLKCPSCDERFSNDEQGRQLLVMHLREEHETDEE